MLDSTLRERVVPYQWDSGPGAAGEAAGSTARAGLASFLRFVLRAGVARALAERVRRPVPERCTGFPQLQKSLALLAALAAGCRSAGYQATAVFAGDTGGGGAEVLAIFLDPGNAQATWRFADARAALERVLGPLERLPGLVLRFDCQYATPDDLALLLRRRSHFVGRVYADATAAGWAQEHRETLAWHELSPIKGGADLGAPRRPAAGCRRL